MDPERREGTFRAGWASPGDTLRSQAVQPAQGSWAALRRKAQEPEVMMTCSELCP